MAIVRYAGNRMTGLNDGDTKPTESSLITGTTFQETDTDDLYMWDGDSWNVVASDTVAQTVAGRTLTLPKINDASSDHTYDIIGSELTANRNATLPVLTANDTFVFNNTTATFQGKTIVHAANGNSVTGLVDASIASGAAIAVAKLAASTITIGGTATTLGGTITALTALTDLDLTAGDKTIFDTVGNNTLTIGAANTTVAIAGDLTIAGTQTVVNTVTMNATNAIVFEGSVADNHETTLTIVNPTADRTVYMPNQSVYLPVLAAVSTTQISSTPEELNVLDGINNTVTAANLNALTGSGQTALHSHAAGSAASESFAIAMAVAL